MLVSTILIAELQPKHMSDHTGPLSCHGGGRGYPSTSRKVLGAQQLLVNLYFFAQEKALTPQLTLW